MKPDGPLQYQEIYYAEFKKFVLIWEGFVSDKRFDRIIFLSRTSHLTKLIIKETYLNLSHAPYDAVVNKLTEIYWIYKWFQIERRLANSIKCRMPSESKIICSTLYKQIFDDTN